jgi:molybdopterin-guanine dinucleotide biosynthesis protein A
MSTAAPPNASTAGGLIRGDAAVILAGGGSRRMGRDKALIEVGGRTLLEGSLLELGRFFERLLVSVGHGGSPAAYERIALAAAARGLRVELVEDLRPGGLGPLAGVEAALERLESCGAFFLAVDLPELEEGLVEALWLAAAAPGCLGAMPAWRRGVEPAFAVYNPPLRPLVKALLDAGERRLQSLAALEGMRLLDLEGPGAAYRPRRPLEELFRNLNTPEELERFRRHSS